MLSKTVAITQDVKVTIDETKFDEAFFAEFRASIASFDSIDDHIEHLAQLYARGVVDNGDFIEGYGPAKDMGIEFEIVAQTEEILL